MLRVLILAVVIVGAGLLPARAAEEPWIGQGTVIPSKSASLRVSAPRTVTKVLRDIGGFAKKGDVLIQFDEESARAAHNLTQLALKKSELILKDTEAKAAVAKAKVELHKADRSSKPGIELAEAELAVAVLQIDIAKIDLDFAKEAVAVEKKKMEELTIRAPFDGLVSSRYAELGDTVAAGTVVMEMIGPPMIVQSSVPDRLVKLVAVKTPVEVSLLKEFGGDTYQAEISRMATIIDSKDRTFAIQVTLPEKAQMKLFPGMIVNMKIVPKE
jgi:RND family efflux transporter MFP subunit